MPLSSKAAPMTPVPCMRSCRTTTASKLATRGSSRLAMAPPTAPVPWSPMRNRVCAIAVGTAATYNNIAQLPGEALICRLSLQAMGSKASAPIPKAIPPACMGPQTLLEACAASTYKAWQRAQATASAIPIWKR